MKRVIGWMIPAVAIGCLSASTALAQTAPYDPNYPGGMPPAQPPSPYATSQTGMISTQPVTNEVTYSSNHMRAPVRAFELKIGVGYTQGFGRLTGPNVSVGEVAQEGVGFSLHGGYRATPKIGVGIEGEYQEFRPASSLSSLGLGAGTRGMAGNINASYHILPFTKLDPYVQLGTGYRVLWETFSNAPDVTQHGFELAKVSAGVDVRLTEDIAIAPVIGADLTAWAFRSVGGVTSSPNISDWGLASFIYAGVQGHFDLGGQRYGGPGTAMPPAVASR